MKIKEKKNLIKVRNFIKKNQKLLLISFVITIFIGTMFSIVPVTKASPTTYTKSDYVLYRTNNIDEALITTTITYTEELITSGWPYYIPLYWYFKVYDIEVTFDYIRSTDPYGYLQLDYVALRTGCGDLKFGSPPSHGFYQHYCVDPGHLYNKLNEPAVTVKLSPKISYDRDVGVRERFETLSSPPPLSFPAINANGNYLLVNFILIRGDAMLNSFISQVFQFHHDLTICGIWYY